HLCQMTGSEPLVAVNFKSDGRPRYLEQNRAGTPQEAAELVSYCNDPNNSDRITHGYEEPYRVKLWQIGNETSYPPAGKRFTAEENADNFLKFARAMKKKDPEIKLIGWGGQERGTEKWWLESLVDTAGDYLDYVAFHMMQQQPVRDDTILTGRKYMQDRKQAWKELNEIYKSVKRKLNKAREVTKVAGAGVKLAITEGHLSLKPHNRNLLLNEWLAGLYHARIMNLYIRNSDLVKISTLSDFFGNRWTVNSINLGDGNPFLTPSGIIMKFFKKHMGKDILKTPETSPEIDISISKSDNQIFINIVNSDLEKEKLLNFSVKDYNIKSAEKFEIAVDIASYVDSEAPDTINPEKYKIAAANNKNIEVSISPASVSVIKLKIIK
ncbi:MAG: alpha-L-arabinofuranosidase C-terminal domain-containing protein, partial [bacterium]